MRRIDFTLQSTFRAGSTVGLLMLALVCPQVVTGAGNSGESAAESSAPSASDPSELPEVEIVSETRVVRVPRDTSAPVLHAAPAHRAFVDPDTGELTSPPPSDGLAPRRVLDPRLARALSTSHDGLRQVRFPDGTVKVDLQGRFQSLLRARVGEDGTVSIGHVQAPGPSGEPASGAILPTGGAEEEP